MTPWLQPQRVLDLLEQENEDYVLSTIYSGEHAHGIASTGPGDRCGIQDESVAFRIATNDDGKYSIVRRNNGGCEDEEARYHQRSGSGNSGYSDPAQCYSPTISSGVAMISSSFNSMNLTPSNGCGNGSSPAAQQRCAALGGAHHQAYSDGRDDSPSIHRADAFEVNEDGFPSLHRSYAFEAADDNDRRE